MPEILLSIQSLHYYCIKSCAGTQTQAAYTNAQGLRYDRRWMLVDTHDGRFLTQRDYPHMACIIPVIHGENGGGFTLIVSAPKMPPFHLPLDEQSERTRRVVTVWRFTGEAWDEGDAAAAWFSDALQTPCRLVQTPPDFARRVAPETNAETTERVGFADGFPLLLASDASLDALNHALPTPVPMSRFRPNVVVGGADLTPWAEDNWQTLSVGETNVRFRVASPCARCAVTTVDQQSGQPTGPEPLQTLARLRRDALTGKVLFGINLVHRWDGTPRLLRVGNMVTVR